MTQVASRTVSTRQDRVPTCRGGGGAVGSHLPRRLPPVLGFPHLGTTLWTNYTHVVVHRFIPICGQRRAAGSPQAARTPHFRSEVFHRSWITGGKCTVMPKVCPQALGFHRENRARCTGNTAPTAGPCSEHPRTTLPPSADSSTRTRLSTAHRPPPDAERRAAPTGTTRRSRQAAEVRAAAAPVRRTAPAARPPGRRAPGPATGSGSPGAPRSAPRPRARHRPGHRGGPATRCGGR